MKNSDSSIIFTAISSYGDTIATTFDFSTEISIFECVDKRVINHRTYVLDEPFIPLRAAKLQSLGVSILICGAISNRSSTIIDHAKIKVISGITGLSREIMDKYLSGDTLLENYRLPGFDTEKNGCNRKGKNGVRCCQNRRHN